MTSPCSTASLESALAGNLPAGEEASLHRHLEACEACRAALERIAGGGQWCQEAATLLTDDEFDHAILNRDEWSGIDFTVEHLEPADEPNVLGRLGGYDVLEIIGRGGMGVVLKAFDRELKRCVAIKMLAPHLAQSSLAKKRFAREAQAAAAIVHPHVLAIHQVQPNGRLPFLVMPLVAGESLAGRLAARGTLELKEILRIGMQAAAGLAAAHEQGLVHRDVKPANILLEKGIDRAVLTDFGLARAADDVAMTRWGVIAGTPQYMSPEQARGEPLDGRSDLFSLGCVLYEMATGISPFRADSTMATLRRLVDDSPQAMASLNPELPAWFIAIVDRLLEKEPSRRFGSAREVSELLEGCLAHVQRPTGVPLPAGIPAGPSNRLALSRIFRLKGVIAMSAVLGMGLLSLVLLQSDGSNSSVQDAARTDESAKAKQIADAAHPKADSSLLAQKANPSARGNESGAHQAAGLGVSAPLNRRPVPTEAEKKRATILVRSIYKTDFENAKTPSQKEELAKKLLSQGKETANDHAGKFVLLKSAQELAETAGDLPTAMAAWDELSGDFEVKAVEGRWGILKKLSNTKDVKVVTVELEQLHEAAVAEDQFEVARNSLELLLSKSAPKEAEQYQADLRALEERIKRHSKAEAAFKTLQSDPADAGANAVAGEYLCVFKQDWSRGIALLARGNQSQLKKFAKLELADTTGTTQQLALADAWWDYGDKQSDKAVKTADQERASFWYSQALSELGGLDKLKAEKRIATTASVTDKRAGVVRWHIVGVFDGKDKIVISRKATKWEHQFADWPTAVVVNGKPWTPKQTPEVAFDAAESAQMKDLDFNLTQLNILRARGEVKLEIHPDNVVIAVDDGPQRGSDKYDFEIILKRQGSVSKVPLNRESKLEPRDRFSIEKALSGVPGKTLDVTAVVRDRIDHASDLGDAGDSSEVGAKSAPVRVKESKAKPIKLHCQSNLDPKTQVLTLTYDWASNDQLLDFDLKQTKPILEEGVLKLQRGESIRHVVDFTEITITAQVLVPEMNGNLIGTSGGAATYLGGAHRRRIYLSQGKSTLQREVPIPQRTGNQQIAVAFTAGRLAFDFGNAPEPSHLEMKTQNFHAGHLDLSGGEVGYQYGTLTIRGKLDDASAAQYIKAKASTGPVTNPEDKPGSSKDESR